jgi:hypothetical protein
MSRAAVTQRSGFRQRPTLVLTLGYQMVNNVRPHWHETLDQECKIEQFSFF